MKHFLTILFCLMSFIARAEAGAFLTNSELDDAFDIIDIDRKDIKVYKEAFDHIAKKNTLEAQTLLKQVDNKILVEFGLSLLNKNKKYNLKTGPKIFVSKEVLSFKRALRNGKTKRARLILENKKFIRSTPRKVYNELMTSLSFSYFLDGMDTLAYKHASKVANKTNDVTAHWIAGLSAYRLKNYQNSAKYFDKLSKLNGNEWVVAGGGYWGSLVYEKLNNEKKSFELLNRASLYARTFYGMLAIEKLLLTHQYQWENVSYINNYSKKGFLKDLLKSTKAQKALILLEINQDDLAAKLVRANLSELNDKQKETLMFLFNQYKVYHMAIYLSNILKDNRKQYYYDDIAYPQPLLESEKGWFTDKALMYALIRQESSFDNDAQSMAGAKGLLQIMPNTAYHISKDKKYKRQSSLLLNERINIYLGQLYVEYLLSKDYINGNLFYMMTAYNAGPTKFLRWKKKQRYNNNPLMYIETIPAQETRLYIKRVMTNYWIYNVKMNKENSTLTNLINNKWPKLNIGLQNI